MKSCHQLYDGVPVDSQSPSLEAALDGAGSVFLSVLSAPDFSDFSLPDAACLRG